ncbi:MULTISPECIES: O-antigen ligase family protein [unclassified Halomonas]|uniref:O-antigen ligase family protein n=1 Tax=unclassified Halomonas TaxID=2609666 RepID=UPI001C972ABB|nr:MULTISPECIES: O-antigen ligase family protein [unclassified Halomonas]MBY5925424.1 O-antigen ligase family protein [Halomonas sp. DP4Y7-2]MBY6232758.1 O-antigen ligase family protein [Halomonas sp. DP4Y7-1]
MTQFGEGVRVLQMTRQITVGLLFVVAVHLRDVLPSGVTEVLLLSALFAFVARKVKINRYLVKLIFILLLFAFFYVLSFFVAVRHEATTLNTVFILLYGMVVFAIFFQYLESRENNTSLIIFVRVTSLLSVIYVLAWGMKIIGYSHFDGLLYIRGSNVRVMGFLNNPNYYSLSMLFSFFVSLYLFRLKQVTWICVFLISLGVIFSLSRGAILAISLFILVTFLEKRFITNLTICIAIFILACFSFLLYETGFAADVFTLLFGRFADSGGGAAARLSSLMLGWHSYSSDLQHFLFGVGPGNLLSLMENNPHNSFARILFESGVLGFLAYVTFITVLLLSAIRQTLSGSAFALGMVLSLIAFSLTNDYYLVKDFWLILALAAYCCQSGRLESGCRFGRR